MAHLPIRLGPKKSQAPASALLQKISILAISLMLCSPQAISASIPQLRDGLQLSQGESELLGTLPSLSMVVSILLSSSCAQRFGMKRVVVAGLTLAGLGGNSSCLPTDLSRPHPQPPPLGGRPRTL